MRSESPDPSVYLIVKEAGTDPRLGQIVIYSIN